MLKFKNLSIKTKLILIQLFTTFVVLTFLSSFFIYDEWKDYKNTAVKQLKAAAGLLSPNIIYPLQFSDVPAAERVLSLIETQSDIINAWIYSQDSVLFAKYSKKGFENYSFPNTASEQAVFTKGYLSISKTIIDEGEILGTISLRLDASERWESLLADIFTIIAAMTAGFIAAFLMAVIMQKKISGPIFKLTDKSEQVIKTGDYSIRVEEESSDEIGYLSRGFNRMMEQTESRERQLYNARDQLQTVLDAVPGTISWLDSDLNYLGVNRNLADVFNLEPQDFLGRPLGFIGSSPDFVEFVQSFFNSGRKRCYREISSTVDSRHYTHLIIGQKYAQDKAAVFIGVDITQMKEAEAAVKSSEERLSLVLEASNTGIWDFDVSTKSAYYSPRWKTLLGCNEDEVKNTSEEWENRLHPEERDEIIKKFDDYLAEPQGLFTLEYRMRHKDGSFRWVRDRSLALTDEQGNSYRMLGSIADITERKRAEEELRLSEDKFSKAFHSSPDMIVITTVNEGRFIEVNDAFVRIMQYSREDILGKTAFDLDVWLNPELRLDFVQTLKTKGSINNYEINYRNKSGEIITCMVSAQPIVFNKEDCLVFVARDISSQKKALEERAALNHLTSQLTASITIQKLGRILAASCRQLLKHDAFTFDLYDESTGFHTAVYCEDTPLGGTEPVEIELSKNKTTAHAVKGSFKGEKLLINRTKVKNDKESTRWGIQDRLSLSLIFAPVRWEDKCIGIISAQSYQKNRYNERDLDLLQVLADHCSAAFARVRAAKALREAYDSLEIKVSDRTKELAEANARLQELDRLKSMFLASMSHELRTPLNSIIGFTGLLLMGMAGEMNDEQKKQLGLVKNSANHLLDLINDILDISKIEAGRIELDIEEFNLMQLINEILQESAPLVKSSEVKLAGTAADNIFLQSDRRRVKQVLMNLVSNAAKFTEKGSILIEALMKSDDIIKISVADTGIGIPAEDLNKLFKPFQQLDMSSSKKYEGTGLGLHLSSRLAALLGGTIEVSSEYGKGSIFTFSVPIDIKQKGNGVIS